MTLRPTIIDCAAIAAAALICLPVAWSQNTFPSSGNVGVGTTSPAAPLQIANNGAEWSGWNFGTNLVINGGATPRHPTIGVFDAYDSNPLGVTNVFGDLYISTLPLLGDTTDAPVVRMVLKASGNVGIGTLSPQHLLHVAGTIGAEQVIVSSTGADYVFAPGYRLRSLGEVSDFVKQNQRLPEIPSAKEMQEKGASLGEMQTKLLAKIEELTLYLIREHERADRLEKELTEIKEEAQR